MLLVDSPGYGHSKVKEEVKQQWKKLMDFYIGRSKYLHRCLILIDSRKEISKADKMLIDVLNQLNKPYFIVFTKIDRVKSEARREKLFMELRDYGFQNMQPYAHLTSA